MLPKILLTLSLFVLPLPWVSSLQLQQYLLSLTVELLQVYTLGEVITKRQILPLISTLMLQVELVFTFTCELGFLLTWILGVLSGESGLL